jgi:NDP-sugar pyrophosphorylase family protein
MDEFAEHGAVVGAHARLPFVIVVFDDAVIGAGALASDSVIGGTARVGAGAVLAVPWWATASATRPNVAMGQR